MQLLAHAILFALVATIVESQSNNWTNYYPDNACAAPGQISLEFEGGPSLMYTSMLLDALSQLNVSATFYVNPMLDDSQSIALMKRIVASGHTLGLTVDMRNTTIPYYDVQTQVYNGLMQFNQNVGVIPRFISGNLTVYDWVFTQMGFVQQRRPLVLMANSSICSNGMDLANSYISKLNSTVQNNLPGRSYAPRAPAACNNTMFVNQLAQMVRITLGYKFVPVEECLAMPGKYMSSPPIMSTQTTYYSYPTWTPTPTNHHGHDDNSGVSVAIKWNTFSMLISVIAVALIFGC